MSSNTRQPPNNEEPEIGFEESVPLDGPDPEGERMIDELGQEKRRRNAEHETPKPAADGEPMPEQFPAS